MAAKVRSKAGMDAAKAAKNDEFYTQLSDIEAQLNHFKGHFKGKVVLCNCDDPYESNFFRYFALNFRRLGIKKLIASCYAGSPVQGQELSLFDLAGMTTEEAEAKRPYKVEITEIPDANHDGAVDLWDVEHLLKHDANVLSVMEGDGDFRSPECLATLDEADMVVTNPPFSLFHEYVPTLIERGKHFVVIGPQSAITYKEVFPLIENGQLWLGPGFRAGNAYFRTPNPKEFAKGVFDEATGLVKFRNVCWFTNLDFPLRHENLILTEKYDPRKHPTYDNYDAIEVPYVADIPEDWSGVMGVPISFLTKHNPAQFEIVGIAKAPLGKPSKVYPRQKEVSKSGEAKEKLVTKLNDGPALKVTKPVPGKPHYLVGGEMFIQKFARLLVRRIGAAS